MHTTLFDKLQQKFVYINKIEEFIIKKMNYSEDKFVTYLYPKVENWKKIKSDLLKYYNKEWFKMDRLNVFGQKTKKESKTKEMEWI